MRAKDNRIGGRMLWVGFAPVGHAPVVPVWPTTHSAVGRRAATPRDRAVWENGVGHLPPASPTPSPPPAAGHKLFEISTEWISELVEGRPVLVETVSLTSLP